MRKITFLMTAVLLSAVSNLLAQTATFDDLTLEPDSFWNGSDLSGGFYDEGVYFVNYYDTSYGGFWNGGFAYSNMVDSVTAGYTNEYSVMAGHAYSGDNFAVVNPGAYNTSYVKLSEISKIDGFYITNSTYAYISMRDGDDYAKKFGGDSGDDPDWFKLTAYGYSGTTLTDSAEFYLADYRFSDNSQDYIVKEWKWFDLSALGNVDSVVFKLNSSDVGDYGMNTPAFFCMDNLSISPAGIQAVENTNIVKLFPNPVSDILQFSSTNTIKHIDVVNIYGQVLMNKDFSQNYRMMDLSKLSSGIYFLKISTNNGLITKKIIKK